MPAGPALRRGLDLLPGDEITRPLGQAQGMGDDEGVPGSVKDRLWPNESGFENLFLAGDWTRNGIDGGSVEAAVTSGMLAARAIGGSPRVVHGTKGVLESDRGEPRG